MYVCMYVGIRAFVPLMRVHLLLYCCVENGRLTGSIVFQCLMHRAPSVTCFVTDTGEKLNFSISCIQASVLS